MKIRVLGRQRKSPIFCELVERQNMGNKEKCSLPLRMDYFATLLKKIIHLFLELPNVCWHIFRVKTVFIHSDWVFVFIFC